ncbi:hypothetical protein [Stenotrophomonas maltophilia]|uniref:hypothetical protein n=1 Tax=Stenotrophomonas maltophilia TaxID=40324 RepID=UPI0039C40F21
MKLNPTRVAATLVLVGPVSPALFHPEWFKSNGLIKAREADSAEIQMVNSNISLFKNDWLNVDVRPERIQLRTEQEPFFPVLRDLALGCLNCLPRVPFRQLGINWEYSIQFPDRGSYDNFGHALAPKAPWQDVVKNPGMLGVAMQSDQDDGYEGTRNYSVRPDLSGDVSFQAIISHNDHYSFESKEVRSPNLVIECISERWEGSRANFDRVASHLLEVSCAQGK